MFWPRGQNPRRHLRTPRIGNCIVCSRSEKYQKKSWFLWTWLTKDQQNIHKGSTTRRRARCFLGNYSADHAVEICCLCCVCFQVCLDGFSLYRWISLYLHYTVMYLPHWGLGPSVWVEKLGCCCSTLCCAVILFSSLKQYNSFLTCLWFVTTGGSSKPWQSKAMTVE